MLTCGSHALVIGGKAKDREGILYEGIIWEFETLKENSTSYYSSSLWKGITKIPSYLCEDVNKNLYEIEKSMDYLFISCIGFGDCVFFILDGCMRAMEVAFYNSTENTWGHPPSFSLENECYEDLFPKKIIKLIFY